MIQAQKDANAKEQKSEDPASITTSSRTVASAAVRTVHVDPRRTAYVTSALGTSAVILSDGSTLTDGANYQYHRVALGNQLQHVVTPVQITGTTTTVASDSLPVNSRCVVTSPADLARILVAVTTNSVHTLERSPQTVSVSAPQQAQTIGTIANVVTSNQRLSSGILGHSVPQTSIQQRLVLNSGMSDVYVRISPSAGSGGSSPQFMVLDSSSSLVQSSDVNKVHSYSLASAAVSGLSTPSAMQKVVISAPAQPLHVPGLPNKAILTTAHNQVRTSVKRSHSAVSPSRSEASIPVNNVTDVMCRLSVINKLLTGSIACEGKISSIPSSPKHKKVKLDKTVVNKDVLAKRKKLSEHFAKKIRQLQFKYYNQQAEYFFLKGGGNIMDHIIWKKKIPTELIDYLRANRFDPYDEVKLITEILSKWFSGVSNSSLGLSSEQSLVSKSSNSISSSHSQSPSRMFPANSNYKSDSLSSPTKNSPSVVVTHRQIPKPNFISSVYDSQIGSREEIVERAKQEAYVVKRVQELRKEGLWSLKRLPKVVEVPRLKAHWDYLLEEMQWLATDFAQERKWKKAAAKKQE